MVAGPPPPPAASPTAAPTPASSRDGVYVAPATGGRGVGRAPLAGLLASTDAAGVWTVQVGMFPENTTSIATHRGTGFRIAGTRERLGRLHGQWRDVLVLERRSPTIT